MMPPSKLASTEWMITKAGQSQVAMLKEAETIWMLHSKLISMDRMIRMGKSQLKLVLLRNKLLHWPAQVKVYGQILNYYLVANMALLSRCGQILRDCLRLKPQLKTHGPKTIQAMLLQLLLNLKKACIRRTHLLIQNHRPRFVSPKLY